MGVISPKPLAWRRLLPEIIMNRLRRNFGTATEMCCRKLEKLKKKSLNNSERILPFTVAQTSCERSLNIYLGVVDQVRGHRGHERVNRPLFPVIGQLNASAPVVCINADQ